MSALHEWLAEERYRSYAEAFPLREGYGRSDSKTGDLTRLLGLARHALASPSCRVKGPGVLWVDFAPWCGGDTEVNLRGEWDEPTASRADLRAAFLELQLVTQRRRYLSLTMRVPCRACEQCLKRRAWEWKRRARLEVQWAPRTWFTTLTFHPDFHALAAESFRFNPESRLSEQDQLFRHRVKMTTSVSQKFLKRLRKNSGAKLRYLLIVEKHKSGLPHLHGLIHETTSNTVLWEHINAAWGLGFHKTKLVDKRDPKPVAYCCKYLTKSIEARVRASQKYGALPQAYLRPIGQLVGLPT